MMRSRSGTACCEGQIHTCEAFGSHCLFLGKSGRTALDAGIVNGKCGAFLLKHYRHGQCTAGGMDAVVGKRIGSAAGSIGGNGQNTKVTVGSHGPVGVELYHLLAVHTVKSSAAIPRIGQHFRQFPYTDQLCRALCLLFFGTGEQSQGQNQSQKNWFHLHQFSFQFLL